MKLMVSTASIAAVLLFSASGASAQTKVFDLNSLPTGPQGTQAFYYPSVDGFPSGQGVLNQTVSGTTLSLRTADYVTDPSNPTAPVTHLVTENESTSFGTAFGVPATVQVAITADTNVGGQPGMMFANFTDTLSALSVSAFTFTANPGFSATLNAYSGLNGTGTLLGTFTGSVGASAISTYRATTLSLSGLNGAQSFSLQGTNVLARYDTFTATLGAATTPSVPEPATWAMMLTGFAMVGAGMRRRIVVRKLQTA